MAKSKSAKAAENSRALKRARDARYKAKLRDKRNAEKAAELTTTKAELKRVQAQLERQRDLAANLEDDRAPLDMDHFIHAADNFTDAEGKPLKAGVMSRAKRQEYNRSQGDFADALADPASLTDEGIRKLARLVAGTAEEERRFTGRRAARLVTIQAAREALFLRSFSARAAGLFRDKVVATGFAKKKAAGKVKRILNLHVSDTHIGARLPGGEYPTASNAQTEARRLAYLCEQAAGYKTDHRDQTHLNLLLNGDLIEGLLGHSNADTEDPLTDQHVACLHMLVQMVTYLSHHFRSVDVWCSSGNHGRNVQVHPGRATAQKWDSFETTIYVGAQLACRPLQNVRFHVPLTPYCVIPLFSRHMLMTHGDTVINVGNPAKSVNVDGISKQINAIVATKAYAQQGFDVVVAGHVHTGLMLHLPASMLIVNGPLTPPNGFALGLGFFEACSQWMWESTPDHVVGDARLIRIGPNVDKDASLDQVIRPVRFSDGTWLGDTAVKRRTRVSA